MSTVTIVVTTELNWAYSSGSYKHDAGGHTEDCWKSSLEDKREEDILGKTG